MRRACSIALVLLIGSSLAPAQQINELDPRTPERNPALPTITFMFELAGGTPSHYSISVDSTSRAAYTSDSPEQQNLQFTPGKASSGAPYIERFTISESTRERIFDIAQKLNYFNGSFDYTKTRVANTGAKTLIYADPTRHFQTNYNWSQNQQLMGLTRLFQGISTTIEFGRRLQRELRFDKLALDSELKQLQDVASHNDALELQIIVPTLEKIARDSSVMHIARKRAQSLLAKIPGAAGTAT